MEVFSCIFSQNEEQIKPISADIIEQNTYKQYEPYIFFGDGAEKLIEIWSGNNCKADLTITSSSTGQLKIAYEKFLKVQFEDVAYFEPYYLKDFVSTSKKVQS
jgi:tRNA threonylcarbamoyladenosine biosynthesis protein TsaB